MLRSDFDQVLMALVTLRNYVAQETPTPEQLAALVRELTEWANTVAILQGRRITARNRRN